jgi:PilZ domain-containing protein
MGDTGMKEASIDHGRRPANEPSDDNRRGTERVPAQFSLMYSGMHDGRMLIGNGVVSNVSKSGIGIVGNHLVKLGMDLSLFIDLPGIEEPICIAECRVSWVSGRRFGVEMIAPKLEVQNELRFYVWNHLYRQTVKKS